MESNRISGWKSALGCTYESLAIFRILLGTLLVTELILRYRFLHAFYSDEGTLPLHLLRNKVDSLYQIVCLHCNFGELWQQQVLLSFQVAVGILFGLGVQTRYTSVLSWYLYLSLTLRNTWMNYILDRYFHYLLFCSIFLPVGECWTISSWMQSNANAQTSNGNSLQSPNPRGLVVSPGTIAIKALVAWIYVDAGYGKYNDPGGGWFYSADPLPALDTYARHTLPAQYLYALIGPSGLRLLTPVVLYIELWAAPLAFLGSIVQQPVIVYTAIVGIVSLHLGIAIMLRNAALLSFIACVAWCPFLPIGWNSRVNNLAKTFPSHGHHRRYHRIISTVLLLSMLAGNLWLETISRACDQSVQHIWSTIFHNRWNVFVGAEEYVTWEIAPGRLRDGSIVDVWGRSETVDWSLPGSGAPCTATGRPGRWRSFPYLAELKGLEGDALWQYLCKEWNADHHVNLYPGRELLRYKFFMLQADVLPNMGFSATRKRLVQTIECVPHNSSVQNDGARSNNSKADSVNELESRKDPGDGASFEL